MNCFHQLPRELIVSIFLFLNAKDLRIVSQVCRLWRKFLMDYDQFVWKDIFIHNWRTEKSNFIPQNATWKTKYQFEEETESRFRLFHETSCDNYTVSMERVSSLQFDWKSNLLVCGGRNFFINIYDLKTKKLKGTLKKHTAPVFCIQFDANLDKLVSSGEDSQIKIWSLKKQKVLYNLSEHTGPITRIQFDAEKILSCSDDTTLKQWDLSTGKCIHTFCEHMDEVWSLHYENSYFASGSNDKTTKMWDFRSDKSLKTLHLTSAHVRSVFFSDNLLLCASFKQLICYDLRADKKIYEFSFDSWINYARFDATKIVAGNQLGIICIYDLLDGRTLSEKKITNLHSLICFQMDNSNIMIGGQSDSTFFYHFNPRTHPIKREESLL